MKSGSSASGPFRHHPRRPARFWRRRIASSPGGARANPIRPPPFFPLNSSRLAVELATESEPPLPIDPQQFGEPPAPDAQQRSSVEPVSDLAALYFEGVRLRRRDVDQNEAEARAFEVTVRLHRDRTGCSLEDAKAAVLAAIKEAAP